MDTFQAIAEPTRRHIMELLASQGQLSASDISYKFSISPPAISQHLKVLHEAKLVDVEKHAQQRMYQINPHAMGELEQWFKHMTRVWNDRFDTLDEAV